MIVHNGRSSRSQLLAPRGLRLACVAGLLLAGATAAEAGPIRRARTEAAWNRLRAQSAFEPRFRPLAQSVLPTAVESPAGGPLAGYFRWALQNQVLRVNVPRALRGLQPQANGQLPNWAFVDYLSWRRSLNPTRFDLNHPNLAQMLVYRPTSPPICPPCPCEPTGPVRPQTQTPEPPQIPEPSSALIALTLLGAGVWAHRRRGRIVEGVSG